MPPNTIEAESVYNTVWLINIGEEDGNDNT